MPTTTRLYRGYSDAMRAIEHLETLARPAIEPSILGGESLRDYRDMRKERDTVTGEVVQLPEPAPATAAGGVLGAAVGGSAGLLAGLGLIAIPGLGPVAAAGWFATAVTAAAGGALAGASIGALIDLGIPEDDADLYREVFQRGGVAVSVRFPEEYRQIVEEALSATDAFPLSELRRQLQAEKWRL